MIISQFPQRRTKNLLINAGFRVNQRVYVSGTATAAANEYTLDRWRVLVSGESITFPPLGADNTITAPAGGMGQKIESLNVKGGVYTVQWQGTAACKVNGIARKTGESFIIPADTLTDIVFYGGSVNKPQLEEGAIQTEFDYVLFSQDKVNCFRYFHSILGSAIDEVSISIGVVANGNAARVVVDFPVAMRVSPTVLNSGAEDFQLLRGGGSFVSVTGFSFFDIESSLRKGIHFNTAGSLVNDSGLVVRIVSGVGGYLYFDAEI